MFMELLCFVIQSLSRVWLCKPMGCNMPGFPVLHYLLEFAQTHVHWVGDAIQPSYALSPSFSPALNLSQLQGLFQWVGSLHQVAIVLERQLKLTLSPSKEYSGLISFRTDWFDLLAVQGTLKSLLKHHSSKASILWCSAFFMAQLSHPNMTIGKTIASTRWTFVGKVMSLLLNMLSRFVIAFLKEQVSLNFMAAITNAVILEPKNIESVTVSIFSPIYLPWGDGNRCYDLCFFKCWVLSQLFHSLLSPSSRGSLVPLQFLP